MLKTKEQQLILEKYALAFSRLLDQNIQENSADNTKKLKKKLITNLGQLSVDTELRPATLSDIFSGKSNLKAVTIVLILKSLGKSYLEFAEQFEKITDKDVADFRNKKYSQTPQRGRPTKKK